MRTCSNLKRYNEMMGYIREASKLDWTIVLPVKSLVHLGVNVILR